MARTRSQKPAIVVNINATSGTVGTPRKKVRAPASKRISTRPLVPGAQRLRKGKAVTTKAPVSKARKGVVHSSGIPMAGLRRLAFQAGIRELSAAMYSELRGIANDYLGNIVSKSVLVMDSNKPITTIRKQSINSIIDVDPKTHNRTILARHVTEALRIAGTPMYVGLRGPNSKSKLRLPKRCALDPKTPRSELAKKKALRAALPRGQSRVTKYQAEAGCFMLPSAPIHRTVRDIAAHTNIGHSGIRLSKEAAAIIQLATEAYLVKYLKLSTGAAAHAGRVRVFNRNIRLMQAV